ncbi:diguanylate cyclase (GGDEF)-like protein [Desulfobaculum xiamenense]|uniref:diguanylate cyclase n=1 Tax=Desulfobaculum xiamenense TaxID=995050 RepID=A0A846QP13_9BACT|nr:GGDEF domain-containing protein [Desulfobaculum xiamenense]NJB68212.1 diguanylate cyclase (GGDEF)-like protein [Desulfobaculum xiamenense]
MHEHLKSVLTTARQSLEQTFPPAMAQLLRELVKQEPNFEAIAKVIQLDPAMSAAILNLVNSPFYGMSRGITDLKRAAVVLGTREILKIALSVAYLQSRSSISRHAGPESFANWRMVVWSAIAAELLAERLAPEAMHKAYLCTLLKDISLVALAGAGETPLPSSTPGTPLTALQPGQLEAERDLWSIDHGELSTELLSLWGIPDLGCDGIRHHHDLAGIDGHPPLTQAIILATRWAELVNDCGDVHSPDSIVLLANLTRYTAAYTPEELNHLRLTCLERFRSMLATIGIDEAHPSHRLYEHSVQSMQSFHFQSMEIAGTDGGTDGVATLVARQLRWNFGLDEWNLALHEPGLNRFSLYASRPGSGVTPLGAAQQLDDLPWDITGHRVDLSAFGSQWGELRLRANCHADESELGLYVRFLSRALEQYARRQAVLVSKARTLDNLPVGVARLDAQGRVAEINLRLFDLLGNPRNPKGRTMADCLGQSGTTVLGADWDSFLTTPRRTAFSKIFFLNSTTDDAHCMYLCAHRQTGGEILFMIEDITELTAVQKQALQHGEFLGQIVKSMQDVVLTVSATGLIAYASPAYADDLTGRNLFECATPATEDSAMWGPEALASATSPIEVLLRLDAKRSLNLELVVSSLLGAMGGTPSYLVVGRDLTEIRRLEDKLRRQATRDGLTGLFNHYQFNALLEREMQRSLRTGRPLGLLFFDLDGFKEINDTRGHQAGDELLREIAQALRATIRKGTDFPCRYGGDEFAVIATESSASGLMALAERIHAFVSNRFRGTVGMSMGAALLAPHEKPEDLLRRADKAAYAAKAAGGNRICWAD